MLFPVNFPAVLSGFACLYLLLCIVFAAQIEIKAEANTA